MSDNKIILDSADPQSLDGEGIADRGPDVAAVLSRLRSMVAEEAALDIKSSHLGLRDRLSEQDEEDLLRDPLVLTPELRVELPEPAPEADQVPDGDGVEKDNVFAEAPFADEVALRALVSEIVREELQGDLGERLTANVRKLVRREIAQALRMKD